MLNEYTPNKMWSASCVILLIGVLASVTCANNDAKEPDQCYGPPPFDFRMGKDPDSCCKKPIFKQELRDCLKTTREAIHNRYHQTPFTKSENDTKTNDNAECLAKCVSNNDLFKNDAINRDELIKALEDQTEDKVWTSIHTDAVDRCIEVLKFDLEEIKADSNAEGQCNRVAIPTLLCLNGQYFVRCPVSHFQNDDQNCKKFQEHIKTCPMPRGGPGFGKPFGRGPPGLKHFGPGNFGPGHFGHGHFGPGPFGKGPDFGTGDVFGFL